MYGGPGRGKSHLAEALINDVRIRAPDVYARMVLSRGEFYYDFQTDSNPYGEAPIVVIDDMFHNKSSVDELHSATEIQSFMNFVSDLYDNHRLCIVTSNFSLLQAGGILSRVRQVDKIGRIASRCQEILSNAGEIELLGDDFREELARRRKDKTPGGTPSGTFLFQTRSLDGTN
ncbi:MAG: hypothetical protein K2W82_16890 [Candidatus Obscuribacterales bacterium]|nr:hypothetical protein [Candidatus Obscuribacterales bacterium]